MHGIVLYDKIAVVIMTNSVQADYWYRKAKEIVLKVLATMSL